MQLKLRDWLLKDFNVPKSDGVQLITISILTILMGCLALGELLVDLRATTLPLILTALACNAALLLWTRFYGHSKFIGHAQLLILYAMFQVSFFMMPNAFHVFIYWMPFIPLIALIFGNLRSLYIWLVITLITLWIDSYYGTQYNGQAYQAEVPYLPYSFAATVFTLTIVACFAILYNLLGRSYNRLSAKNREVVELISQLKTMNESLEEIVKERTHDIEERNERLKKYAFMNSHMVRAPLANILGAVNHLQEEVDQDQINELMQLLKTSASDLDEVIKEVGKSLSHK